MLLHVCHSLSYGSVSTHRYISSRTSGLPASTLSHWDSVDTRINREYLCISRFLIASSTAIVHNDDINADVSRRDLYSVQTMELYAIHHSSNTVNYKVPQLTVVLYSGQPGTACHESHPEIGLAILIQLQRRFPVQQALASTDRTPRIRICAFLSCLFCLLFSNCCLVVALVFPLQVRIYSTDVDRFRKQRDRRRERTARSSLGGELDVEGHGGF